jgi:hypothetical protein
MSEFDLEGVLLKGDGLDSIVEVDVLNLSLLLHMLCRLIIFIKIGVKMGSSTVCRPCCGTELSPRHQLLRDKYKILLKDSQYRSTCIRILDSTFQ